ncbi:MAG: ABC transporter ATP-binding protein, partial [Pyramidobacter sp.]|nr:ABC transporter ATP-binding protein [Pyramidobacter sp.]
MTLRVQDVSFSYGKRAVLEGVTFEAKSGEVTAILGANAAGKSTLLKCISGRLRPRGSIALNGTEIARMSAHARAHAIGAMVQDSGEPARLTVMETVLLGRLHALTLKVAPAELERARTVLDRLRVGHLSARLLTELSRTPSLVKYELGCLPGFPYKQLQELISHAQEDPKAWEQSLAGIDLAFHNAMPETARVMNLAFTQGQMLYIHALWVLEVCKTLTMAGAATVESLYRSGADLNGVLLIPVCVQGDREEMYAALDP